MPVFESSSLFSPRVIEPFTIDGDQRRCDFMRVWAARKTSIKENNVYTGGVARLKNKAALTVWSLTVSGSVVSQCSVRRSPSRIGPRKIRQCSVLQKYTSFCSLPWFSNNLHSSWRKHPYKLLILLNCCEIQSQDF